MRRAPIKKNAPACITAPGVLSNIGATLRNIWRPYHETDETEQNVRIVNNCQMLRIVKNCYILRIVKNCYKILQNVTNCYKMQMLRNVTNYYKLLQNVNIKNCYKMLQSVTLVHLYYSTPVLQYTSTRVHLYYWERLSVPREKSTKSPNTLSAGSIIRLQPGPIQF